MNFKFKTISMMMAGAAFALTSCSSEEPIGGQENNQAQGEGIGYMAFSISTDQTRGDDSDSEFAGDANSPSGNVEIDNELFNDGQPNEYAICPNTKANLAIFFNADGSVFGASYLTPFDNKVDGDHQGSHNNGYPEQFYTYVTRWNNTNDEKPNDVLVLLNVDPALLSGIENDAKNNTLNRSNILEKTQATANFGIYTFSGTEYFSMSNSVFFNEEGNVVNTTAIDGKVYETPEQALENKVTVYVERMLSKFELTFGEAKNNLSAASEWSGLITPVAKEGNVAKINYVADYTGKETNLDYPDYDPVSWQIYIANWGMNGVERENSYVKQVNNYDYFGSTAWNIPAFHRSYWAESANYGNGTATAFPTQYRPTSNEIGGNSTSNNNYGIAEPTSSEQTVVEETALTYYSYNHFTKRGSYKYAPERTFSPEVGRKGYGPYRFATHYLVQAQLVLGNDAKGNAIDDATTRNGNYLSKVGDKYAAYNFYFANEESYIRYAYHRMVSQFADGREHNLTAGTYNKKYQTNSDKAVLYTDQALTTPLEVKDAAEYFTTVPALEVHGDGRVMLALAEDKQLWYKDVNGAAVELKDYDINNIAFNLAESANHFAEGRMYYAIPVQHNFGKSNGSNATITRDGIYDIGQFGTVRNHWYVLNIKTIGSVGTPVDNPDQPIIPDPEDIYNIALEIVVLPWHVINNGSVDL